jgi:hypothetical protein
VTNPVLATSPSNGLATVIKYLLVPSWLVGIATVLLVIDLAFHVIQEPFSQMIGNTILIGGFLIAPLTTLMAAALGIWYSVRRRRRQPDAIDRTYGLGVWTLISLSFLCIVAAWIAMASVFRS